MPDEADDGIGIDVAPEPPRAGDGGTDGILGVDDLAPD